MGWFDTHFNACHKRISFSTGPHAKVSRATFGARKKKFKVADLKLSTVKLQYTHWKQTVMYTQDTIAVNVSSKHCVWNGICPFSPC